MLFVEAAEDADDPDLHRFLETRAAEHHAAVDEFIDGKRFFTYDEKPSENGQPLFIRYWEISLENALTIVSLTTSRTTSTRRPSRRRSPAFRPLSNHSNSPSEPSWSKFPAAGAIETRVGRAKPPNKDERRPFTAEETARLAANLTAATRLLARYAADSALPVEDHHPRTLDLASRAGLRPPLSPPPPRSPRPTSSPPRWAPRSDSTSWTITASAGSRSPMTPAPLGPSSTPPRVTAFPIESVRKRIEDEQTDFFQSIALILEAQIEKALHPD